MATIARSAVDAYNDGVRHAQAGASARALAAFATAANEAPAWGLPWEARGQLLFAAGDVAKAASAFEEAIARAPGTVHAYANLALCRQRLRQWSRAVEPLQRARELAPADEAIWWLARGSYLLLQRHEDALADFLRFAPNARPTARFVVAALASARRLGDAEGEARALAAALAFPYAPGEAASVAELLALVQYFDVELKDLHRLYLTYDRLMSAEAGPTVALAAPPSGEGLRRVRIGYLSADFRRHVMGELLAPVLAAHDRSRFAVHLFSLAPPGNADAVTASMRANAESFTDLAALDDAAAAQAIAAASLDLLIDLMGHSAFARPGILARKPARMVATHLGYHGALGLRAVDWKVTDAVADVTSNAQYQLERLLPLACCVLPLRPFAEPLPRGSRAELDIPADAVVAAAFVGVQKLSPRCLRLWRAWLDAAPQGILLFSPLREDDRTALLRRCTGFGLDVARLKFVPYLRDQSAALASRYSLADLALDTLPYTGGDTTAAALAAGVPVVTRMGTRHAERMSASILRHAGLDDLIAADDDTYVALAVRLATDGPWREAMRAAVRAALSCPELADPVVYARALEDAYTRALSARHLDPT